MFSSDSNTDDESLDENQICDDDDIDDGNDICIICGEFGKGGEMWFRCKSCGAWAHQECSGQEKAKNYVCDFCT